MCCFMCFVFLWQFVFFVCLCVFLVIFSNLNNGCLIILGLYCNLIMLNNSRFLGLFRSTKWALSRWDRGALVQSCEYTHTHILMIFVCLNNAAEDWLNSSVILETFEARAARMSVACAQNLREFENSEDGTWLSTLMYSNFVLFLYPSTYSSY